MAISCSACMVLTIYGIIVIKSIHVNPAFASGLISKVMVDPRISAATVNSGISKVMDLERWGVITLAPCTVTVCEPDGTLLNRNPFTPIIKQ